MAAPEFARHRSPGTDPTTAARRLLAGIALPILLTMWAQARAPRLLGEGMDVPTMPLRGRILHALAQAYPDPVDLRLLFTVWGCEASRIQSIAAELTSSGLACVAPTVSTEAAAATGGQRFCITELGLSVANGHAPDASSAREWIQRMEANTLRSLLRRRIVVAHQRDAHVPRLLSALDALDDAMLLDAARIWAGQRVDEWDVLAQALRTAASGEDAPVRQRRTKAYESRRSSLK